MKRIRHATPADAEAILGIYAPYITDTDITFELEVPGLEEFRQRMEGIIKTYPYLVYEEDGKIVGYAYASRHQERAAYNYTANVAVYLAPEYQGHGIGKELYEKLFEQMGEQGLRTALACLTYPNERSQGLHKDMGFTDVGIFHNVGYKFKKWLDVIWLEKPLGGNENG